MKRNLQTFVVPAAIAASLLVGCSAPKIVERTDPNRPSIVQTSEGYDTFGRKWEGEKVPGRTDLLVLHSTGTITDIDYADREVSIQDSSGKIETFVADKSVQRFNEAKVGDKISVDYYLGVNAEIRKPTPQEEQNPLVVVEAAGRAGAESTPAAGGIRRIRAVVTIEALDRANQTVTVKGPRGRHFTARVLDPSRLEQAHIGDTIVLTFTEATVVSLRPAAR